MSVGGHNTTVPPFVFVAARMVGVPLQTKPISKSARFCESISKSSRTAGPAQSTVSDSPPAVGLAQSVARPQLFQVQE